jgi:hypothetical protein
MTDAERAQVRGGVLVLPRTIVGPPRKDRLTARIDRIERSIDYIEAFFATSTGTPIALLQNAAGELVPTATCRLTVGLKSDPQ